MTDTADVPVYIPTDDGAMPAHLWSGSPGAPTIVLFQEIFGVSDYIKQRAADLAALGYTVIAPEIYWRLERQTVDESSDDVLEQAMGLAGQLDWDRAVGDAAGAVEFARLSSDRVGVMGFCFGGGLAYAVAARIDPAVLVSYYGSGIPGLLDLAAEVTAPSLHIWGEADAYIPMETVEQVRTAVTQHPDVEFVTYPGAGHAFDNPRPQFHHAEASAAAWDRTVGFLAAALPAA